jgi:hypothetical protein
MRAPSFGFRSDERGALVTRFRQTSDCYETFMLRNMCVV